jgi:HNH endonuclease
MSTAALSDLSDRDLLAEVSRLATGQRDATVSLIAHLAELHARRLHQRAGFSSLYTYCLEVLHLSESEAYDRVKAAKLVRRYPTLLTLLASGQINLTTVRLLGPHLTFGNHRELLTAACGKRKRDLQELVAQRFPQADVPFSIVHSLSPGRYRITFTASTEACEKLQLAQDLLRHVIPSGDPAQIFERALDVLVTELVRQRYSSTDRPRASRGQADDSRNVPAEVKRAVHIRDLGRCAYVGPDGHRCGERAFVEFHHIRPYAAGGPSTVDNITLRCHAHNGYEADMFYGPAREYGGVAVT